MISEYFLEKCLEAACIVPDEYNQKKELFSSISYIIKWYNKNVEKEKIPTEFRDKLELVRFLSKYRFDNDNFDFSEIIDKLKMGKYKTLVPLLESKIKPFEDEDVSKFLVSIIKKRKMCSILKDRNKFEELLNDIAQENFEDGDDIMIKFESTIFEWYETIRSLKKIEDTKQNSLLDLGSDNYSDIFKMYIQSYNEEKLMKTGFPDLDAEFPFKALEKRKTYIFAGETNVGKSLILINILCNGIKQNISKTLETFVYVTCENQIDESLIRFYCCLTGTPVEDVIQRIFNEPESHKEIEKEIKEILASYNAKVIFKYYEAKKTTVLDVEALISDIARNYEIKAVFFDYLDKISSGQQLKELRHELGAISQGLINIGINYDLVMITATQLNRTGYNGSDPSNTQLSESSEKAHNVDGILIMQRPKKYNIKFKSEKGLIEAQVIRISITKNRNGPLGYQGYFMTVSKINGTSVFDYKLYTLPKAQEKELQSDDYEMSDDDI